MPDELNKDVALDDRIKFVDDKEDQPIHSSLISWKILIVDDEADVHRVTEHVLSDFVFSGQPISFLHAYSEEEAREIIDKQHDIALILLDVVMEEDYSGLKLINYIRDDKADSITQIIIRTAYPAFAPEQTIIMEYDVNGYINKVDATASNLSTNIIVALHRFSHLSEATSNRNLIESEDQIKEDLVSDPVPFDSDRPLKVLIVDDEESVHSVTKFVLRDFSFENREIINLHAYSAKEAKLIVDEHPDVAVILLDIIMETNDAGLEVIKYVRDTLELTTPRIILRTGQAANLDVKDLIESYDVNDFKNKSEITAENFFDTLYTSIRSYKQILYLEHQQDMLLSYVSDNNSMYNVSGKRLYEEHPITRLKRGSKDNENQAIMIVEIDNFDEIKDTLGDEVSNHFMNEVIKRILQMLRDIDLIGRFGGNELVILLENYGKKENISNVAKRMIKELSKSFVFDDHTIKTGVNIGITIRINSVDNSQLLREADIAMREAKSSGLNTFKYYSDDMDE